VAPLFDPDVDPELPFNHTAFAKSSLPGRPTEVGVGVLVGAGVLVDAGGGFCSTTIDEVEFLPIPLSIRSASSLSIREFVPP